MVRRRLGRPCQVILCVCYVWKEVLTVLGVGDRPRCGRPTVSGGPCARLVRYSAPLDEYAVACRQHMTAEERAREDAEPLWALDAQVLWALQRDGGDGLTVKEIAELRNCRGSRR